MGRKKKDLRDKAFKIVPVRLYFEDFVDLVEICKKKEMTRAALIRELIRKEKDSLKD